MSKTNTVGIVGVGAMGTVFAKGLANVAKQMWVSDADEAKLERFVKAHPHCKPASNAELIQQASWVVFAIKPGVYPMLLAEHAKHIAPDTLLIGLAAGLTLKQLQRLSQGRGMWIRVMPNLPSSVGAGMLSLCASEGLSKLQLADFIEGLEALGRVDFLPEALMDVATALSGSGPAYAFVFIEALADAAVRLGMERARAYQHAAQTLLGAAKLCLDTSASPAQLKDAVTTPGGTTAEGLYALEAAGFRKAVSDAVVAAATKAKQLAREDV
ncbi:MAG: pyrroline-5-carboxylate reductase [Cystobacterineae bacterium]|nr:pyrroline-5-carboxylate reductase [Cystobacterineae bacterium]